MADSPELITDKPKLRLIRKASPIDTGDNPSSDPLSKVNEQVSELIQGSVLIACLDLLKRISEDYADRGLTFEELKERYSFHPMISTLYEPPMGKSLPKRFNSFPSIVPNAPNDAPNAPNDCNAFIPPSAPNAINDPSASNAHSSSEDNPLVIDTPPKLTITPKIKAPDPEVIDPKRCLARIGNGNQCSRKRPQDQDFCGGHIHNQPNGRIDRPDLIKRPSPKKIASPTPSVNDDVIQMNVAIETINGIDYLVDEDNQIFRIPKGLGTDETIDSTNLRIVGKKVLGGQIIWYGEQDMPFII